MNNQANARRYDRPDASAFHQPGSLWFVSQIVWLDRVDCAEIWIRRPDGSDGPILTIGGEGLQAYTSAAAMNAGENPRGGERREDPPPPDHGWNVAEVCVLQTGGMCMVDWLRHENGWITSITDECAALFPSEEDFDEDDGDSHAAVIWFA